MAATITVTLEDVNGSFARFLREAPRVARKEVAFAVQKATFQVAQRMRASAPVGPDAPHIRDAITTTQRGLTGQAGFINATEPAGPNNSATQAEVALYNEYTPNKQPFMRPAAEAEASGFVRGVREALGRVERTLSGGGLL
jgi:hypothetical protein